jgi:hypothetical protein
MALWQAAGFSELRHGGAIIAAPAAAQLQAARLLTASWHTAFTLLPIE